MCLPLHSHLCIQKKLSGQDFELHLNSKRRKMVSDPFWQITLFICPLDGFYYCVSSSLSFLKSVSQWVRKCEICVNTFLKIHLAATKIRMRVLVSEMVRWWFIYPREQTKNKILDSISVIMTGPFHLYHIWLLTLALLLKDNWVSLSWLLRV